MCSTFRICCCGYRAGDCDDGEDGLREPNRNQDEDDLGGASNDSWEATDAVATESDTAEDPSKSDPV